MKQGSLVICRQAGQKIILTIDPAADPQEALQRLLEDGLEISVAGFTHGGKTVRLGIRAPREVRVLREELVNQESPESSHGRNRAAEKDESQFRCMTTQQEMK